MGKAKQPGLNEMWHTGQAGGPMPLGHRLSLRASRVAPAESKGRGPGKHCSSISGVPLPWQDGDFGSKLGALLNKSTSLLNSSRAPPSSRGTDLKCALLIS
jgi:hypothetical protein